MSEGHEPYIPAKTRIPELTVTPILMGIILGIVFGASSLYLALKVGMTVSASIPVAVLSITLFKGFAKMFGFRPATILENNIVQTTGSAGESIAFGIAVTMPAMMILGFEMHLSQVMLVAILGGLLGVLMMIPLRHTLVVKEHGHLAFPEGTACAEVLIAGEKGGTSAKTVFTGFFFGLFYKFFNLGTKLWNDVPSRAFSWFKGASVSAEVSPELLGVGYIIGPRIASIMVAGGILSSWVLSPMIVLFGEKLTAPLFPSTKLISEMSLHEIWRAYILYIGAGAVAAGGIISLIQTLPTIIRSAKQSFVGVSNARGEAAVKRTEQDLSMKWVLFGAIFLVLAIWLTPSLRMTLVGAILVVVFGFLFVSVSSRLTGEIGSSSNPISGMTVATLLTTSLIFLAMGWTSLDYRVTALSIAAIVCCAASNGGTTAQDLKTGYLVGATPRAQQIGLLFGALTSAIVIGYTLNLLNDASTIYSSKAIPQGTIVENVDTLTERQHVQGPDAEKDKNSYRVLYITEQAKTGKLAALPAGKYLVDDAGHVRYLVDPGINGRLLTRDDGSTVQKYEAPKARLMSLIIDGILTQKLPWGLVLLGVAISVVLELCGIAALPFAVGVYLPLSSSAPIFFGGVIRYLVEKYQARKNTKRTAEEEETGPGVLYSSGLIAGGSIAGIALALLSVKPGWGNALDIGGSVKWMSGSDVTSVIAFVLMCVILFKVGVKKMKPVKVARR